MKTVELVSEFQKQTT